jgi:copper chaperone CopZ
VIFLAGLGISLGEVVEIPTIDQTWVDHDEMENAAVFTQEGLRSIKCYGSCMAFAGKMKRVDGVYGIAAFVGSKKIKVTYDSTRVTPEKIQEAFFTPLKTPLKPLKKGVDQVQKVSVMLENFFDPYDFNYMSILLRQKTEAVGLQIEFGCPVNVYVYYPVDSEVDIKELTEIMESRLLSYESQGKPVEVKLNYEVVKKPDIAVITKEDYLTVMFDPYVTSFNGYSRYTDEVIDTYRLTLGRNATLKQRFPYMVSHLSHNNGIIQFKTALDEEFKQVLDILFVDTMTSASKIYEMLTADTLHFSYKDGRKGSIENMFSFEEEGFLLDREQIAGGSVGNLSENAPGLSE